MKKGAAVKVEARANWTEGMKFAGAGWSGTEVAMDAGEEFGGRDEGARPFELLLVGLGGCTGMDVVSLLRKMRVDFTGLAINLRAEKSEEHPHVFTEIAMEYVITGSGLDEAKVRKAIELSQDRYCSVSAMLRESCPINYTLRIVEG